MSDSDMKPRRRRLQFSMRTVLLLMLVVSGLLAWQIDKARKQQAAVAWVRQMGGTVVYGYEVGFDEPRPQQPSRLIGLLGIDFFEDVVSVNLNGAEVDDLTPLHGLTHVQRLSLSRTAVSDLSPLIRLTKLRDLSLDQTEVTDLSPLAGMVGLRRLRMDHTSVSDLRPLAELAQMRWLYCSHTPVSDLSPLTTKTGMLSLNLTGTPVSDISPLAELKNLERLDLRATAVTDLSPLSGMNRLRALDLFDTPVTDLSHVSGKTGLRLELGGPAVNELKPPAGRWTARAVLYKRPEAPVPETLKAYMQQVRVVPIYRQYGE